MHKRINVPAKVLLISALTVMSLLMMSGLVLADEDTFATGSGDRLKIIKASSSQAYFTIWDDDDCDDTDLNCTARVRGSVDKAGNEDIEEAWARVFEDECKSEDNIKSSNDGRQNAAFENCWDDAGFDVEWPIIKPDFMFDITPHCDGNDDECAIELAICYNPKDCDPADESATDRNAASSDIAEFWNDAGDCLYDDDEDDVWECIDDEFQDWLDDLGRNDDYDDLIDELEDEEDDLGIATDENRDYEDDLDDVGPDGGSDRDDDDETPVETYQRRWRNASPTNIFDDEDEVDEGGYSFRPSQDEYLTFDFTSYLDLTGTVPVCNTSIGCFELVGSSSFFQQYLTNFYVQITDRKIVNCMDDLGYDVDDEHNIAFNNPDLINCDERVAEAVNLCPSENIGVQYVLYEMYTFGLLAGILSDSAAHTMRTNLEAARVRAPECLCAAGFEEKDMIISERSSTDPWFSTSARRPSDVCR